MLGSVLTCNNSQDAFLVDAGFELGHDEVFMIRGKIGAIGNIEQEGNPCAELVDVLSARAGASGKDELELVLGYAYSISNIQHSRRSNLIEFTI